MDVPKVQESLGIVFLQWQQEEEVIGIWGTIVSAMQIKHKSTPGFCWGTAFLLVEIQQYLVTNPGGQNIVLARKAGKISKLG